MLAGSGPPLLIGIPPSPWHVFGAPRGYKACEHGPFGKSLGENGYHGQHTFEPWGRPRPILRKEQLHVHAEMNHATRQGSAQMAGHARVSLIGAICHLTTIDSENSALGDIIRTCHLTALRIPSSTANATSPQRATACWR